MTIKEVTPAEHLEWCKQQIKENGLYGAVKEQLDEIMLDSQSLGYVDHGDVMLRCQNILDLVEAFGQNHGIYRVEQNADNITNIKSVGVLNL